MRAPAKMTSKCFPPGTELRVLTAEEFESLFKRANQGAQRRLSAGAPRLVRARHRARWEGGVLRGETELVIVKSAAEPADYVLDVWSPAVISATRIGGATGRDDELPAHLFAEPVRPGDLRRSITGELMLETLLGARDSGMQSISLDGHPRQSVRLVWELEAPKRVGGRSMHLALPGEATTVLALELPTEWKPSVRVGRRRGPLEGGRADRLQWEVEAESGRIELELVDPRTRGAGGRVGSSGCRGRPRSIYAGRLTALFRPGNWSTEWLLELDPRNPKSLEVELDPGLELIKVVGPAVRGFRIEPSSGGRRVSVMLGGELKRIDGGEIPGACSLAG